MKMFVCACILTVVGLLTGVPSHSSEEIEIVDSPYRQFNPNVRPDLYSDCCLRPGYCVTLMCKNVCDSRGGTRVSSCSECKRSEVPR